jgi:DNA-binding CsgD family transcriptional regulator/PAS domain-containing protein
MAVMVNEDVLLAIDRIYESVENPELWPQTIGTIGHLLGGRFGFLIRSKDGRRGPGLNWERATTDFFLSKSDLRELDRYADELGELIVRFLKIVFLSILASPKHVGTRAAMGVVLVQRFLPMFNTLERSATPPSWSSSRNLVATLWEDFQVFTAERLQLLRLLLPHLDRALRLEMRHIETTFRADVLSSALDQLTLGVVLVDRAGMPTWLNQRAQEIIDQGTGLRLCSTGLAADDPAQTRRLRELIERVFSSGTQAVLSVGRSNEQRSLIILVFPFTPTTPVNSLPCGVVFISDPDRTEEPTVGVLRQVFGLTYREAQTAVAVARGQGLQTAADSMGVALTTARSQLQQVFAKTGTRHQAQLAALLHRTLSQLRPQDAGDV